MAKKLTKGKRRNLIEIVTEARRWERIEANAIRQAAEIQKYYGFNPRHHIIR